MIHHYHHYLNRNHHFLIIVTVIRDFDISRFDQTPIVNQITGETIKFGDLKNIVYDGDGVPKKKGFHR